MYHIRHVLGTLTKIDADNVKSDSYALKTILTSKIVRANPFKPVFEPVQKVKTIGGTLWYEKIKILFFSFLMPFDSSRRTEYEYSKNYGPGSTRKKVMIKTIFEKVAENKRRTTFFSR